LFLLAFARLLRLLIRPRRQVHTHHAHTMRAHRARGKGTSCAHRAFMEAHGLPLRCSALRDASPLFFAFRRAAPSCTYKQEAHTRTPSLYCLGLDIRFAPVSPPSSPPRSSSPPRRLQPPSA
jgi:hypothetical protein